MRQDRLRPLSSMKEKKSKGGSLDCLLSTLNLLQQFEYELLLLVSLGQSGYTGLFQDGVLGQTRYGGRNVRIPDCVLRCRQVLHLAVDNVAGGGQPVDARGQRTAEAGGVWDGRIDQG